MRTPCNQLQKFYVTSSYNIKKKKNECLYNELNQKYNLMND